ncbi:alginate export family protein [Sphingomonas sp.]|jgi:hypothetical protein|uniref:alginate export family protein n=1 Tax=Sphingomonas sp. TaxID=28214 RepID=UPI002ED919F1
MSCSSPALGLAGLLLAFGISPATAQEATPSEAAQTGTRATPIATAYPAKAAGDGAISSGYAESRWAEDWRGLADPAKRDDPLDRLKFLPLDPAGEVYLTLSGELRGRVNVFTNPGLHEAGHSREDLNRIFAGADLHIGPHFRIFGEMAHGGIAGRNIGTPSAALRNDLIVQQIFVEGKGIIAGADAGARYGRQEFADGSTLLVSPRDNPTIRTVLDGARGWLRGSWLRADIFDLNFVRGGAGGTGDDVTDRDQRFSGITIGVVLPQGWLGGSALYLEPFIWRSRHRTRQWGAIVEREERHFYGVRLWGDVGRLTLDWTADRQDGRFGSRAIDAWQVFAAQTLRLGHVSNAPRIGFHADYASGGGVTGKGALTTALSPYPNAIYYSYQGLIAPTNLIALAPNFTASPAPRVRITAEHQFTWRAAADTAVYRVSGLPLAGTELVPGYWVAGITRLQAVWTIAPRVSITGRYEHHAAGKVLTRAGYSNSDYLAGWLSLRL